jgi:omega-6 fatty acid desaturase (delta-12 desaturase)
MLLSATRPETSGEPAIIPSSRGARAWAQILDRYRKPRPGRGVSELLLTAVPFAVLWAGAWASLRFHLWVGLVLIVPAAAFLVRLFMIQHDCGHGSFFGRKRVDDWVGRVIAVITLTPYDHWRRTHARHHATSGHLGRRGIGDIHTLTVREYRSLSTLGRLGYRLLRNPIVLFLLGPIYIFGLCNRLPIGLPNAGWESWLSTFGTNLALGGIGVLLSFVLGTRDFLLVHMPIVLLGGAAGVWLFYVQHQFEGTYWAKGESWSFHESALHGSSYYALPPVLRWLTLNIGIHHIHHLCSRIPSYRLGEALRDNPELQTVGRLTLRQSLRCTWLALWDEDGSRLVSFRQARTIP